ncbi:glycosyltransferase family 32 protein [Conidiobolus coronatus NRRL 28638]|uniref:Glycosyltransferase family 32 protein n=1 Tax=Conidiobolus coronatus (strain ATCC 28846 / CBS 209.66 / NRRL 28638) TaxID=796925 RepID=A0A137NXU0_CONC2|nr:glycosyltransferase family 32 protein [Conidiobolus coronatus NRRL 28638]|eukprot:KXN67690.1 glycosyltransferase family 32 protein [Conidiobolus coronatus NRRL 28638]
MNSWENIPNWEYKNENDDNVYEYLKKRFPELDMGRIIKEKKILAFDLWRYAKVYDEGGLYADSDVSKSNGFESSMSKLGGCKVILGIEADSRTKGDWWVGVMKRQLQINQWSFYSAPKQPILKFVIDRIIQRLQYRLDREDKLRTVEVEELTGPAIWTDTLKDYLRLVVGVDIEKEMKCGQSYKYDDICLLNIMGMAGNTAKSHSCPNNPESDNFVLSTHHFEGSWKY